METRDAAEHLTMYRAPPEQRIVQAKMSIMLRFRNAAIEPHRIQYIFSTVSNELFIYNK